MKAVYQCDVIACAMFLTGQASNVIIAKFALSTGGVELSYATWFIGGVVPGVASLLVGAGPNALVLEGIVAILAVASIITVIQRFVYVYQTADGLENPPGAGTVQPPASARPVERAPLDTLAKGR